MSLGMMQKAERGLAYYGITLMPPLLKQRDGGVEIMDEMDKENKNTEIDDENNDSPEEGEEDNYLAVGMCLGMSLGMTVGYLLFNNISTGMVIGMSLGLAIGSSIKQKK